ncbi:MAG: FAD-binding protein [Anaerolineae bacterium]|nr:FAD-binding protein [Anaerolineae bacterium]
MPPEKTFETDVLVIGGGMAGFFAAIKAREQGVDVLLVNKGYAGKSGQSPWADSFAAFNPEWGHDLEGWVDQVNRVGEYVNNREWTELCFLESYARYQDLVSWGVEFHRTGDGDLLRSTSSLGPCQALFTPPRAHGPVLRKEALKRGVRIMDRIMIVELIKDAGGAILGAAGSPVGGDDLLVFKAKATVLCAGAGAFKPPGWPIHDLTSDGDAMAYRAGAAITGKEFVDPHMMSAENPGPRRRAWRPGPPPRPRIVNAEGDEVPGRGTLFINLEFEVHAGRGPIAVTLPDGSLGEIVGGASSGMSVHKAEGVWPADTACGAGVMGLYAAGDNLGTMQSGSVYATIGMSFMGASVTGARAGIAAAAHAQETGPPAVSSDELGRVEQVMFAPMRRQGGFGPAWVTQQLQNAMIPYYVMYIKKRDRLEAALTLVEFMRDHLVPKLLARDPHELRLAHETKNMVLNAEMRLRASLLRTESRGCHYREDHPLRQDPDWLAWVLLQERDGQMAAFKRPIPEAWWPDFSMPYEERYPARFPGE